MSNNVIDFVKPLVGVGKIVANELQNTNADRLQYRVQEYIRHALKKSEWIDIVEIDHVFGAIKVATEFAEQNPSKSYRVVKYRNGSVDETMWMSG